MGTNRERISMCRIKRRPASIPRLWRSFFTILSFLTVSPCYSVVSTQYGQVDESDLNQIAKSVGFSLDSGQTSTWANSNTGRSGSTVVNRSYRSGTGEQCRELMVNMPVGVQMRSFFAQGCQQTSGNWILTGSQVFTDLFGRYKGRRFTVSTEGESFYQRVDETGIGETKEYAIKEAHFFALERELTTLVGYQAEGEVGRWFRMAFDRDFDSFKKRYFTPNTGERRCTVNDSGKHVCSIEGSLKLAALKADMRKVVKTKERMLSDDLVFFLSSADAVDATAEQGPKWKGHANYFVDQLVGIFVRKGHRIIIGKKGLQAVDDGKVDYGLEVKRIDFTDFRQGRDYISGVLRVLFRLTHMGSSTVLASIPITVNAEVQSDSEAVLVTELSRKVSMQIALNVTETVITFQREQGGADVQAEAKPGQETYFLRLMGLEQRDRKELKALRQSIRTMFPDSAPSTDPDQSDATQTTIAFSTVEAVNCDDVLDYFYEAYNDLPGFDATCLGRNEFSLYFRLPSAQPIAVEKSNQNSSGKSKAAVSCQGNWQEKLECRDQ